MLIEIVRCKQLDGEPFRRWFTSRTIDLFAWYQNEEVFGFQICYDKHRYEHALTWRADLGWSHNSVDVGKGPPAMKGTSILRPDGDAPLTQIIDEFEVDSRDLDPALLDFILQKLPESRGVLR